MNTHSDDMMHRHALFVSIPLPGHLGPLVAQGRALVRRGWRVTIASTEQMRSFVDRTDQGDGDIDVSFLSLGECAAEYSKLSHALQLSSDASLGGSMYSWATSALYIWSWTIDMYPCMLTSLLSHLNASSAHQPSIIISDFATSSAIDVADQLGIPVILNNVNVLSMIGPDVLMHSPYIPSISSGMSMDQLHSSPWLLFAQRVLQPINVFVLRLMVDIYMQPMYDRARIMINVPPRSLHAIASGHLIMMNSAQPFEFARSLPAHIQLTGPMINFSEPISDVIGVRESGVLNSVRAKSSSVIVVAFGTIAPWSKADVECLARSFTAMPHTVIWKLPEHHHADVLDYVDAAADIHLVPWLTDQRALVCDPRVSLFISHCGTHSAQEALACAKLVLCIPQQGDQIDNAARLVSIGAGMFIQKHKLTPNLLSLTVDELLSNPSYSDHAKLAAASMRLPWIGGGLEKAVSIIEHVNQFGSLHLMDSESSQPLLSKLSVDVFIVWSLILSIIGCILLTRIRSFCKYRKLKQKLE